MDCKYEPWCGAPLCPLELKVREAFWYSGEEHCHRDDLMLKYDWLGKQSKIARTKGCKDECFNVNMLEVLQQDDINKTLRGMDMDESNDKSWIRDYKLGNRRVKRVIKLEEKPRAGYVNKKGHRCLFVGKKCTLWRKERDFYYVLDQDKKCVKTSKFLDVCENIVRDLEKIKVNKSIYREKREYRKKGENIGESSKQISTDNKRSKIRGTKYKGENVDEENGKVKHECKVKGKDSVKDQDSVRNTRSHEALRNVRQAERSKVFPQVQ